MKASDYSVFIIWSKEDNAFLAQVPELAECVADGATREEALANATVAAQVWIDTAKEMGREIPKPQTLEWFEPIDSETQLRIAVESELEKIIPELVLRVTASISPKKSVGIVMGLGARGGVAAPASGEWRSVTPAAKERNLEAHGRLSTETRGDPVILAGGGSSLHKTGPRFEETDSAAGPVKALAKGRQLDDVSF
jgi:predicted RNase H-like HicB family nuclease